MEYIFRIFFLIIISFSTYFAQWEWQNPLPNGAYMEKVIVLSAERAIVTGRGGIIMTTHDSGVTWHEQYLPEVRYTRKYTVISENVCWIIGGLDSIYKTEDGGMTWDAQLPDFNLDLALSKYRLSNIEFFNEQIGYILVSTNIDSCHGVIYKTENGGSEWYQLDTGIERNFSQILFINEQIGFLLSHTGQFDHYLMNSKLHRTEDGGQTWSTLEGENYFGRLHFVNDSLGWSGNKRTTDGGITWHSQPYDLPSGVVPDGEFMFLDSLNGHAMGNGIIYNTSDAGQTWNKTSDTAFRHLTDFGFYNMEIGYACGGTGSLYSTLDGGSSWTHLGEGITETLYDLEFVNEKKGWVVGNNGTILHTTNGGDNWERQDVPVGIDSLRLYSLSFLDSENGWIIAEKHILNTTNGGQNWNIQFSAEFDRGELYDIQFIDETCGFAVGYEYDSWVYPHPGVIYKTTNLGLEWNKIESNNFSVAYTLSFVDSLTGWTGGSGMVQITTDGGKNWSTENIVSVVFDLQFNDHNHGWFSSADHSDFYRTTNGGETWEFVPWENRENRSLSCFSFHNNQNGIASTYMSNRIMTTVDAGSNWNYQTTLPSGRIHKIQLLNDSLGWAVSDRGGIMKYTGNYFEVNSSDKDNEQNNIPIEFVLHQNYPNPFNPTTTISYSIPSSVMLNLFQHLNSATPDQARSDNAHVTLRIYDILGNQVETLVNEKQSAGNYNYTWDASNYSSGIYIYQLRATNGTRSSFSKSAKMILLK